MKLLFGFFVPPKNWIAQASNLEITKKNYGNTAFLAHLNDAKNH